MKRIGNLFVFEGADAAGKSSIVKDVVRALGDLGVDVKSLAFPGNLPNTLGSLVYKIHHSPEIVGLEKLTPTSLQALHIAAHLDALETIIIPTLERGGQVVLDRYWWSTWVYGHVDGMNRDLLDALIQVERIAWGKWQPAHLFYITRKKALREEPEAKWRKLKSTYEELVAIETGKYPIQVIHNESKPEVAVNGILKYINDVLGIPKSGS